MNLLQYEWLSFFIVGLGTLFLFGELLVKARGIFAVLGVALISAYFITYLDPAMLLLVGSLYFGGLILIVIDGELLNDGILASIGGIFMIVALAVTSPNLTVGSYAVLGLLIGSASSLIWMKIMPRRNLWSKITLLDRLTDESGYHSINANYHLLVGKEGVAQSDLRPVGRVLIEGEEYSAITKGQYMKKDTKVKVIQVDGTRILIEPIE